MDPYVKRVRQDTGDDVQYYLYIIIIRRGIAREATPVDV